MRVLLPQALRAQIQAQAQAPLECCGLLEGLSNGEQAHVAALHPAANLAASAQRFEINPADHFAAQKSARAHGRAIIGCYHSHPGGAAQPSAADLAGAQQDGFLWLIANGSELNAFVYRDGEFLGCVTGAD